ncbi:rhythmically expressed gene 2 protein [Tribolium castaneum]|uniref:Rhythmically expressed gene 2 protein-like Protein n=1 Tax=Tribolium castaneum TaxID=7070 RepID=D6WED8_TRICA|nr:PREDICTED: rhythmically expressed gene 2 protein [Tribolium castaneum]EFA00363.1 Rhythmically expressed gene 2 protein-like Protein [Tribolium castaneum]|eukprot:XP_971567.1 PREDICTED: rhythmically expressed gene 2 protein [Tribolium castaneum]
MNLSRFRLITFDVTDTLLKFRSAPGKQYGEVGAMYGVLVDSNSLSANFKSHWHKMNAEHPNFGKNGLGWQSWWKQIVVGTFKDSKLDLDDRKLDSIASHLIELYETSMCWQPSYGALGLLSYLRHRGVPMGVISNFDPRLDSTLVNTKLRHYFKFVTASYEVGVAKPSQGIFEKAMEMSGISDIKPEECLHVGNTVLLDYVGARKSGWSAALIHDKDLKQVKEKYPFVNGNYVFSSLYELHRYFLENSDVKLSAQSF